MIILKELTDRILMQGMVFYGFVGVLDYEKSKGQDFIIDVTIACRRLPAADNDQLSQTIDYGEVYLMIRQIMEETRCDLIERLAGIIAQAILDEYDLAQSVEIMVRKPHAPIDGTFSAMGVSIYRERSE